MYICPTCHKGFQTEEMIRKHFLTSWKEQNPFHKSKSAPRGEDIEIRKINDDVINFFNSFKE